MNAVRAHLYVSGVVQGVFYRATARDEAIARNMVGWVRNTGDGKVEILLEGVKENVDDMIKWCYKGPPSSKVTDIKIEWDKAKYDISDFKIIR